ncbi:MAG TPA: hypothetical protein VJ973_10835, partial [Christiangramia sp.]|nr:hypothetical protein [Christiangramia sp.]
MKNINPTKTKAWKELEDHFGKIKNEHMRDMFKNDKDRAEKFTLKWEDLYVDLSKNRITGETRELLL